MADDVKLQLAKDGVCETIYRLLETYKTLANTNEARALMKLACDLIVLILTGGKHVVFVALSISLHTSVLAPFKWKRLER